MNLVLFYDGAPNTSVGLRISDEVWCDSGAHAIFHSVGGVVTACGENGPKTKLRDNVYNSEFWS